MILNLKISFQKVFVLPESHFARGFYVDVEMRCFGSLRSVIFVLFFTDQKLLTAALIWLTDTVVC